MLIIFYFCLDRRLMICAWLKNHRYHILSSVLFSVITINSGKWHFFYSSGKFATGNERLYCIKLLDRNHVRRKSVLEISTRVLLLNFSIRHSCRSLGLAVSFFLSLPLFLFLFSLHPFQCDKSVHNTVGGTREARILLTVYVYYTCQPCLIYRPNTYAEARTGG